jgi:hypothetical protein
MCFLLAANPSYGPNCDQAADEMRKSSFRRIILPPHLEKKALLVQPASRFDGSGTRASFNI